MRIVVTLASDADTIDHIICYCWQHEKDGIHFSSGRYLAVDDHYWICKIDCLPSKYADVLLLRWADYLTVV